MNYHFVKIFHTKEYFSAINLNLNFLFRVHYISKLKAIDTSEKDRALADLEKERTTNRELNLRY